MSTEHTTTPELSEELKFAQLAVFEKLDAIDKALKTNDPLLELHCEAVRKQLSQYEELVHLLKDEQIATLMTGMKKWQNIQLVAEAVKSKGRGKKITADDL